MLALYEKLYQCVWSDGVLYSEYFKRSPNRQVPLGQVNGPNKSP